MGAHGGWTLEAGRPGYPQQLEHLEELAPATLYGLGSREQVAGLEPDATVTIVGSRRASSYGLRMAEQLAADLAASGATVVSGMAIGIDSAAHRGALEAGAGTVAVLGGGPDVIYPASERGLYRRIAERGAVVSEHPPGVRPTKDAFPKRNRIMAALAGYVLVVEAAEPSGSLISARLAQKLGRDVGAVPGQVGITVAAGSNALLRDGAHLVSCAEDVLDRLAGVGSTTVRHRRTGPALDAELRAALERVEAGATTADEVALALDAQPRAAAVALARLELLGYLTADSSGAYDRTTLVAVSEGEPG